ncbi:MAG TPA: hypothetical protein VKM72_32920 [Thermoanaerobaculia bacterium]|nr:hypothetical protein [Thermoanaerobaculia bacterium]
MLNVAGSSFDFGNVLFAVLQECEHVRRGLLPNEAQGRLMEAARRRLAEIRESYVENGGTPSYWEELEREVLETSLPAYIPEAIEQTRLEKSGYDVWRRGDATARVLFALAGLVLGGLIIKAPFIPIWEDAFAFILAVGGLLYPEVKQLVADFRHSRLLNRTIAEAEKYQKNARIHYVSEARLEKELNALGKVEQTPEAGEEAASHQPPHREKGRR